MPALTQSFFCCKLETGGVFIGWLLLLVNIGGCIFFLYFIIDRFVNEAVTMNDKATEKQHPTFFLFMYLFMFVILSLMSHEIGVTAVKKRDLIGLSFSRHFWSLLAIISAVVVITALLSGRITVDKIIIGSMIAIGTVCAIVFSYFVLVISSLIEKFSDNVDDANETNIEV